jgi:hypothetical protein
MKGIGMPTPSSGLNKVIKRFFYGVRNSDFVYQNIINRKQVSLYKKLSRGASLSGLQYKIVSELKSDGIATSSFNELFPNLDFNNYLSWIQDNETNLVNKKNKKFLYSYYGTEDSNKPIDLQNPFIQLYLSESLLEVVSTYLGYLPQLFEVYVEKTVPIGDSEPQFSQNWHRDPEEKRTLKVFMYLNDVDENCGPFTYIKKSQPTSNNSYSKLFKQELPWGSYPSEAKVNFKTDPKEHFVATGKKGTIIFCDTAGLHRGGYAKNGARIMSTGFFPSFHYTEPRLFKSPSSQELIPLGNYAKAVLA